MPDDVALKNGVHEESPLGSSWRQFYLLPGDANRYIDTQGVFDSDATARKSAPT
jgi:hypothetical protein